MRFAPVVYFRKSLEVSIYALWTKGLEIGEEINTLEYTRKQWDSLPPSLFKHNVLTEGIKL